MKKIKIKQNKVEVFTIFYLQKFFQNNIKHCPEILIPQKELNFFIHIFLIQLFIINFNKMQFFYLQVPLKSALATYHKDRLIRCYYYYGCGKSYFLSRIMERPCPNDFNNIFISLADWNYQKNLDFGGISYCFIKCLSVILTKFLGFCWEFSTRFGGGKVA